MDYTAFLLLKIRWVLSEIDTSALAPGLRLHDESLQESPLARLAGVMVDFGGVVGVEEGAGVEVVLLGELVLHFGERECEGVFPGDDAHGGEVVYALRVGHLLQGLVYYASVAPFYMPVLGLPEILNLPVEALAAAHLLQDGVFGVCVRG